MRLISFILACQICFLTVAPVVNAFTTPCDDTSDRCTTSCSEESTDCAEDICNPFEACVCCCLNVPPTMTYTAYSYSPFKLIRHVNNNAVLDFCSDCFHPPEVI